MYNTTYTNFKIHNSGFLWEVERELGRQIKGALILVIVFSFFYNIKTKAKITKCQIVLVLGDRYISIYCIILRTFIFAFGGKETGHIMFYS